MKKFISSLFFIATFYGLAFYSFAGTVLADQNLCPKNSQFKSLCALTTDNLGQIIGNFISFIFLIAVIAALFYLIWGGLKWLMSAGDKTALQAAREHIVAAIVGLIIIFLSYLILNFVIQFFIPDFSLSGFKIPKINNGI